MYRCRRLVIGNGGISLGHLQCYLCSICFLVMCAVFSSLFITSSLPLSSRHRTPVLSNAISDVRTVTSNKTISVTVKVGPPSQSVKVTDTSVSATEAPATSSGVAANTTHNSATPLAPDSLKDSVVISQNLNWKLFGSTSSAPPQRWTDHVTSDAFKRVELICGQGGRNPRIIHDPFPYIINEESFCSGSVFLLIAVHSKASYRMRRDLIRQTWGSVRYYEGQRIKTVFFIGSSDSRAVQEELIAESRSHRDLIQRDFVEHYRNMSRKHVSVLRWVADHCNHAAFFAKVDDDTFVNIFHTIHLLKMRVPDHFMCKVVTGYPIRSSRSNMRKWFVTRHEYPFKKYPLYCEGFAYLVDVAHVRDLYWCSQFTKFFWIDDIFITGIVAKKLKVTRERLWNGHSWAESIPSLASEKIMDYVFVRAGHNEILPHLWIRIWRATLKYSY